MMNRLTVAMFALTLASCGHVADLEPRAGETLPQKPALASSPLNAEQLLELPPHAKPKRVDELNKRGEVRTADRFDLPPPDGAAVPPPAGADEGATPSTTGPDNQEPQR
jgi:hypothetical protein